VSHGLGQPLLSDLHQGWGLPAPCCCQPGSLRQLCSFHHTVASIACILHLL
jgi:hypothetical protein